LKKQQSIHQKLLQIGTDGEMNAHSGLMTTPSFTADELDLSLGDSDEEDMMAIEGTYLSTQTTRFLNCF